MNYNQNAEAIIVNIFTKLNQSIYIMNQSHQLFKRIDPKIFKIYSWYEILFSCLLLTIKMFDINNSNITSIQQIFYNITKFCPEKKKIFEIEKIIIKKLL